MKEVLIPKLNAKGDLYKPLMANILCGLYNVLGKEGKAYYHLFCRLIDKSVYEYNLAQDYILEEIKTEDRLAYVFSIINHLENCINAISRADKVLDIISNGIHKKGKKIKKKQEILKFIDKKNIEKLETVGLKNIRNRIEHIDEDVFENKMKGGFFLNIDEKYENIYINNKCLKINDLAKIIDNFNDLVLSINKNLPKSS